ncbi:MAG: hypothetical protein K0R72_264 [Clostridia bacterium]|jgi:predicted  nucleic acid-binding Zn-ribbon protein|nr:hypothetical protein [Clostridia bacterium]
MAINTINLGETEIINKMQERINVAEEKLNNLFASYNIPDDITDNNTKLAYVLAQIGDDQTARQEMNKNFEDVQKEVQLTSKNIEEDFINMTNIANARVEKYAALIKEAEESFNKKVAEKENNENKIKGLNDEIKTLNDRKIELQGADGKGGKIAEEKANSVRAKDEAKTLAKKIADIDAKIKEIDEKIKKLEEANKNTNDPAELEKNAAEIASLQSERANLSKDRVELTSQYQAKEDEKSQYEANIRKLQNEVLDLDTEINAKAAEKNILENELRLMPIVGDELKQLKEEFEKQRQKYIDTVEATEKTLNERGINVKAAKIADLPEVEVAETPVVEGESVQENERVNVEGEDDPIVGQQQVVGGEEPSNKEKNKSKNSQQNNGYYYTQPGEPAKEETLPVVTPEDKKKEKLDYILGYSNDGVGLSSEDRLKRIQSELGGRDYEAMTKAFEELKKSPVPLTKEEKNKVKEMMKIDKKNLAQTIKDLDPSKLEKLIAAAGIDMDKSEIEALYRKSFEDQSFWGKANNGFKDFGEASYGVLDGFTQMSDKNQSKWQEIIKGYAANKENMSEDEIKDFEKYILTPVKFGTLQAQSRDICKNKFFKLFTPPTSRKTEDIRSAISEVELPEGQDIVSRSKAKDFTETLRGQTETYPPNPERGGKSNEDRNKDGR